MGRAGPSQSGREVKCVVVLCVLCASVAMWALTALVRSARWDGDQVSDVLSGEVAPGSGVQVTEGEAADGDSGEG